MTKTFLITAPLPKVYQKAYQWLSIQEYEIVESIKNAKLVVRPGNYRSVTSIGILLLLCGLLPGLLVLASSSRWTLTLSFEGDKDGTFVKGVSRQKKPTLRLMKDLGATMSMLNSE